MNMKKIIKKFNIIKKLKLKRFTRIFIMSLIEENIKLKQMLKII
jgi:hypothetical protein